VDARPKLELSPKSGSWMRPAMLSSDRAGSVFWMPSRGMGPSMRRPRAQDELSGGLGKIRATESAWESNFLKARRAASREAVLS